MWRFRNKEIKIQIGIVLVGTAVLVMALGAVWGKEAGYAAFFCCLFWCVVNLAQMDVRYRRMRSLARQIDEVLHGKEIQEFQHFREGDLEILRDEIFKMTVRLKEQAELLQKEKTSLADALADISHQIRTPLTALNILFERIKNPDLPVPEKRRLLREAEKMLDKIEWLVTALLKISKLEAGAIALTKEHISMPEFLEDVFLPFEVSMDVHGKARKIIGAEGISFSGDYAWTLEAVQNVIKNGLEYTPDGGTLTVCCADNPLFTEIKITDSGTGIPVEDLPHLFERFYKGKNAGAGSFGIGLALAQMILTREHGVIQAQNAPDGGGQFRIRFYKTVL
ncbi:MAG: HAMP domain-containing histidine kinase [Coprococcus sp.]|nr:HAMP domain-containing histidine kinase [Coprococcus sp.]